MSRRSKKERQRARRALDYRGMMALRGDALDVRPYVDRTTLASGAIATPEDGARGLVTLWDVVCKFPLIVGPGEVATDIVTRFDISSASYPVVPPAATVVSKKKPFSTHVYPPTGVICIGPLWEEVKGKEILAELVLRVVKAYNFDEPTPKDMGFQPEAIHYVRDVLHGRPYLPDLALPVVADDLFEVQATRPRIVILGGIAARGEACPAGATGAPARRRISIVGKAS